MRASLQWMRALLNATMARHAIAWLCLATLAACVILPVPIPQAGGPTEASRTNVPLESPDGIVRGQTTRADVLMQFGEPDGRGSDDQWFTYESQVRRGGVRWAICVAAGGPGAAVGGCGKVGHWLAVRRMVVRFDATGTVADVSLDSVDCSSVDDTDCPSSRGGDLQQADRETLARQQAETLGPLQASYPSAFVSVGAKGMCHRSTEGSAARGALEVRSHGLDWQDWQGQQHLLAWDADTAIEGPAKSVFFWWVDVRTRDGACTSFTVHPKDVHGIPGKSVASELRDLLLRLRDAPGAT